MAIQRFGFEENLMTIAVAKAKYFIFDRWTIARPLSLNIPAK